MIDEEQSLLEWLEGSEHKREELYEFAKSTLPPGISSSEDMDRAIQHADEAARILADAESFLTQETARAILTVKEDYPELSADERKYMAKNQIRNIKRIVDGVGVTHATIRSRIFAMMNMGRSRQI